MQKIAFFVSWPILNALFLKLSLFLEFLDFSPKSSIFVQKFDFGKSLLRIFAKENEAFLWSVTFCQIRPTLHSQK